MGVEALEKCRNNMKIDLIEREERMSHRLKERENKLEQEHQKAVKNAVNTATQAATKAATTATSNAVSTAVSEAVSEVALEEQEKYNQTLLDALNKERNIASNTMNKVMQEEQIQKEKEKIQWNLAKKNEILQAIDLSTKALQSKHETVLNSMQSNMASEKQSNVDAEEQRTAQYNEEIEKLNIQLKEK